MLTRIFLQTKDLIILTGKSERTCRREYQQLKDSLGKSETQKITLKEYADYTGTDITEIKKTLEPYEK